MKKLSILISPEVKSAYFKEYIECSKFEIQTLFPSTEFTYKRIGQMDFFECEMKEADISELSKLSFFLGVFEHNDSGLTPLDISNNFKLTDQFIFGSKFKGKTNERFTQFMLNIGLSTLAGTKDIKVLDPMCGRATTLLWSMRYGINAKGIEVDPRALADITQIVKKWSKVCDVKSHTKDGFVGKKNKLNLGKFLEFHCDKQMIKVITGNADNSSSLLSGEKFDLIISDIPYGIQHLSSSGKKNQEHSLVSCLPEWKKVLKENGTIVIGYNSNNPKRETLVDIANNSGFSAMDLTAPHRMSESIVRDILVLKSK